MNEIRQLIATATEQISKTCDLQSLENLRVHYLGKKSRISSLLHSLTDLDPAKRREFGKTVNDARKKLTTLIQNQKDLLAQQSVNAKLATEAIDITLPGRGQTIGSTHPVTKVRQRLEDIFVKMGFELAEGPEIEDEFHNFIALNFPKDHPAMDMHDTFYLNNGMLLRTHTSPVQIRYMQHNTPPLKVIASGKVFRCDSDATHTPMFNQLEGFIVDENISFAELKGLLNKVIETFFEEKVELRFRPSYFPFTEPSAEVDFQCIGCHGKGCQLCKNTGWIEGLGCGMVHPNVFKAVGIDSELYTGFAFGIGLDRFAMFRYGINDLRLLFANDLKFLEQF